MNLNHLFLLVLISALCGHLHASTPFQLITQLGSVDRRSGKMLASFSDSHGVSIIGVVDFEPGSSASFTNKLFQTNFNSEDRGITTEVVGEDLVLLAGFDNMLSVDFCGSKAAEYFGQIADAVCVLLPGVDLLETLDAHNQFFRRLLTKFRSRLTQYSPSLVLVVRSVNPLDSAVEESVLRYMTELWKDIDPNSVLTEAVKIMCFAVSASDDARLLAIRKSVTTSVQRHEGINIPAKINEGWKSVSSGFPKTLLTPEQRASLYEVETCFTKGLKYIDASFRPWTGRVNSGKVVGKFGERIQQLVDTVRKNFNAETAGCLVVRDRAARAAQLSAIISTASSTLFKQQLAILQTDALAKLKHGLIALARKHTEVPSDEEQQLLRKIFYDFQLSATEIEIPSLNLLSTDAQGELNTSLKSTLEEFADSPYAKLEAVRKVERQSHRAHRQKQKGLNIALNLVGMLRPPGNGGLQGFVGYSSGLLGLPVEFLLGVHNDGDSPEILGEDREHAILRLQPKINFDINL